MGRGPRREPARSAIADPVLVDVEVKIRGSALGLIDVDAPRLQLGLEILGQERDFPPGDPIERSRQSSNAELLVGRTSAIVNPKLRRVIDGVRKSYGRRRGRLYDEALSGASRIEGQSQ